MTSLAVSALQELEVFPEFPTESDFSDTVESAAPERRECSLVDSHEAGAPAYERAVYQPSARSRPLALLGSAAAILAMLAGMATLNTTGPHKHKNHLTMVELRELDVTPPPPPPEQTRLDTPAPPSQTFAPKPMIEIPVPGPQQVMVDAPPPPPSPAVAQVVSTNTAPAPAAPAAPAATTLEGGDLASKVLFAKPPAYPVDARRGHEQGTVKLRVLVGSDGIVKDIEIAGSSGSARLDRAALSAVRRWRWAPTMSNGSAVAVRGYVTIPFVLT